MTQKLYQTTIDVITDEFDRFIGSCIDEQGKPKAPSMKDLMRARGCLPSRCTNTLTKKEK